ncbi:DUF2797 domain-containing protein [Actinacidiphila sp. bgisy167]|uniref:DUF2797 domain-containing protein n=1 Tax=Actinacidiphila sp. bgisy167 TaxID=3413797 RepID=UPI003D74629B
MWRCTGLRWVSGGPAWTWWHPRHGDRRSPVRRGEALALAVEPHAVRQCAGVWRSGRWTPCPRAAELPPQARRDQCEQCAALDRSRSVAADTLLDDPRPFAVYLAWFGPGLGKVGITAAERGSARLLEQAAICFTFIGHGPLMAARRAEAVLGSALGIPDRVSSSAKRAARVALPPAAVREAELRTLHEAAAAVPDWQDTLTATGFRPVDHAAVFGVEPDPPRATAVVTGLASGSALTGTVAAVAGGDVYLRAAGQSGGVLLLDTRLVPGWPLTASAAGLPAPPVQAVPPATSPPEPLF